MLVNTDPIHNTGVMAWIELLPLLLLAVARNEYFLEAIFSFQYCARGS